MTGIPILRRSLFLVPPLLLVCSLVAERILVSYQEPRAEELLERRCAEALDHVQLEYTALQQALYRTAVTATRDAGILSFLSGGSSDRAGVFERLRLLGGDEDLGIEVYDRDGFLVSWVGRSGPEHLREVRLALENVPGSNVARTQLFSELFCTVPVREEDRTIGVVLVRRILELNYPFTNSILTREGLQERLSAEVGMPVEFRFGGSQEPWSAPRTRTRPVYGPDSVVVGIAGVGCPDNAALLENTREVFRLINAVLVVVTVILVLGFIARPLERLRSLWIRVSLLTLLLWGARVLLSLLDVPDTVLGDRFFGPTLYATQFPLGLAQSAGDLLVSVITLLVNVAMSLTWVAGGRQPAGSPRTGGPARYSRGLLWLLLSLLLSLAFGAVTRSIVFDSSVTFCEETVILPTPDFLLLVFCGLIVGMTFLMLGSLSLLKALVQLSGGFRREKAGWVLSVVVLSLMAMVPAADRFPILGTQGTRLAAVVALVAVASVFRFRGRPLPGVPGMRSLPALLLITACLWYVMVDVYSRQKDRRRVEAFAEEVLRPVDSWFSTVVEQALGEFSSDAVIAVLDQGDAEETARIAFTVWAHSLACREGYASVFAVTDARGEVISRFSIGGQTLPLSDAELWDLVAGSSSLVIRDAGSGVGAVRMYAGAVPIRDPSGAIFGHGRVMVAAARQTLFRGETPSILRSTSREGISSYHRRIFLSEFRNGIIAPADFNIHPLGTVLPGEVSAAVSSPAASGVWLKEQVSGRILETYYVWDPGHTARVVAMSMDWPSLQWHVAGLLRVVLACGLFLFAATAAFLVWRGAQGVRPPLRFKDRLLVAFLLVAVVPMAAVAVYAQWFAGQRLIEQTTRELEADTRDIAGRVAPLLGLNGAIDRRPAVDRDVERIAVDRDADFSLYLGASMLSSSAPTLYEAGILDRRLSGDAYREVVLGGKQFFMETESIGEFRFAVGYRPLIDSVGNVLAVVSLPTVFRQDELRSENARTTTFILGLSVVVLILVVLVVAAIASTIAAPIQDLTRATARVASGDLDVSISSAGVGGELGGLMRSFGQMVHDLRANRDALVRYERDLAWKEMAKQVAHEIKNPLTPMKLSLQHLRKTFRDRAPEFEEVLEQVSRTVMDQIDALGRIATEFSQFARMPKRVIERCDVLPIVGEVAQLYAREPKIRLQIQPAEGLSPVAIDRDELRRLLINIVRNSVQAMNGRGLIEIHAREARGGIELTVQDHGPGMSEDVRSRLFEPGFTTKPDGMGLGLTLVKRTIDEMGGGIAVVSRPGEGTAVTLWLPAAPIEGTEQRA